MFSHVTVGVTDFPRAFRFYSAVLEPLGLILTYGDATGDWACWRDPGAEKPLFVILLPEDDQPASVGNGQMVAFLAPSRAAVDRFHEIALAEGGSDAGAPGLRPQYHPDYYGAYIRDPDGVKLCACRHQPEG